MYVSYGSTESGDDLPVIVWRRKPSNKKVEEAYKELVPYEYEEGCPVSWQLDEAEVR
ncbi:hypothetical protein J2R95_003166 [Bradyrhizobium japonicum]|jgi:hypothetical protein|uniref:hypothetical protein n=1 Tax=Bradyrhizobium japonicum TaxID=375 RepID=UPI0020A175A6|nr:hypothetical protein [Bradyrhizobium japonicum]MCP1937371.1 hypothetical protein [Bradyrhizobium japonicum]